MTILRNHGWTDQDYNKDNYLFQLEQIINGNIQIGSQDPAGSNNPILTNIKGAFYYGTTPTVGTSFTVPHNLGYIPIGYSIIRKNAPVDIYYDGTTPWDITNIYLKANAAGVAIIIFVWG